MFWWSLLSGFVGGYVVVAALMGYWASIGALMVLLGLVLALYLAYVALRC